MTAPTDTRAREFSWLLSKFSNEVPGVAHTVAVSADGLVLAASEGIPENVADQFAAITSGLESLTWNSANLFGVGDVVRQIIETRGGFLLIARINERASLGVVTGRDVDLGQVGYEMTLFTERAGKVLTPDLIDALKNSQLG